MKLIKPIIAVFLLLIYSFAFAVELIPHCHIGNQVEYIGFGKEVNHPNNHQHVKIEDKDADDVFHKNHLDDSLLDFVICILSELDHPELDIFHQDVDIASVNNTEYKILSKSKIIGVLFTVFNKSTTIELRQKFNINLDYEYQLILIKYSPHRGPPSFSC